MNIKNRHKPTPIPLLRCLQWVVQSHLLLAIVVCIVALPGCDTVENIGYWDNDMSGDPSTERESEEPPESDTSDSDSQDSDTTSETNDTDTPGDTDETDSIDTSEDSATEDTDTDSDTETQDVTIPFSPSKELVYPPIYPVLAEDNVLDLPGVWYKFTDDLNTGSYINVSLDVSESRFCAQGQIAQWTPGNFTDFTMGGLGVWLCSDYNTVNDGYQPLETCSYFKNVGNLEFRGVSFNLDGSVIPEMIILRVFETVDGWGPPTYVDIPADISRTEYLFDDVSRLTPSRVNGMQIFIPGNYNQPVAYDFCITDFALLVAMD